MIIVCRTLWDNPHGAQVIYKFEAIRVGVD